MKNFIVVLKSNPTKHWYPVEAPSKRVARWCALNMFQNEYCGPSLTVNDFKVYPSKWETTTDIKELNNHGN